MQLVLGVSHEQKVGDTLCVLWFCVAVSGSKE
jgi:hypothetical protein